MQSIRSLLRAEKARREFWEFCTQHDPEFFKKRPFLQKVADALQRVADGKVLRLAISMPPRAGKSRIASLFAAWMLGKFPTESIMRNCCTAKLYNKFSYDTRQIIRSDHFRDTFPGCELQDDKQALDGWNLTTAKQVSYFGAGVGGTIIGFGATKLAMTDDLYKSMEEAMSENIQDGTNSWYASAHKSRMEKGCAQIDIGTRWTTKDTIGINMEAGLYDEVISVPAFTPEGVSFCEDVRTTAEYLHTKETTDETIWNAEYMQEPIEAKGLMFSKKVLKRFRLAQLEERMNQRDSEGQSVFVPECKLGYIDVADEGDDALSFPIGYVFPNAVYITDWIFTEEPIEVTVPECGAAILAHELEYVRVETNNQGGGFRRDLKKEVGEAREDSILKVRSQTHKHTRIMFEAGFIKKYFHFLDPADIVPGSQYDKAMTQLTAYLKRDANKKDDSPDSCAGLSKFIQSLFSSLFTKVTTALPSDPTADITDPTETQTQ